MATFIPGPLEYPNRAIDHFATGFAAASRTTGVTYTSGSTARLVAVLATPAAAPAAAFLEVKDALGTFRRMQTLQTEGGVVQRAGQVVVPPMTGYRLVNSVSTWTIDAAYEADL